MHVLDASRVVDVVANLLSPGQRPEFERANRELQQTLREQHGARREQPLLSYDAALKNRLSIDWPRESLPTPSFVGRRIIDDLPLRTLVPFIDWTFFFAAWELKGRFPAILDHPQYGVAARDLYANARALLDRIVEDRQLTARGVYGFWPAASEGDDVIVRPERESRPRVAAFQHAAAAGENGRSPAESVAGRLRRAASRWRA